MNWQSQVSLASKTWWKIGGEAEFYFEPSSFDEFKTSYLEALKKSLAVTVLGGGTNVLVSDDGIQGLVISTAKLNQLKVFEEEGQLFLEAEAGVPKSDLVKEFLKRKLDPALFLCGLPGDVGGGVVMNAGVSENIVPREFGEIVRSVEVLKPDGELKTYSHDDLNWVYRKSLGWEPGLVYKALLSWPLEENLEVMNSVRQATRRRLERQPLTQPSCGSTFKNPKGSDSAGALIEKAGLKGYQVGQAQVSPKHANFIVNLGGAKAQDVHQIIQHIQKTVFDQFGIELEREVRYLGHWDL
ncbi:MAG: UDP-N-acetylenolpyruvoylglucosamine reductase [Bdellovibrionaceae bacterium]|nr:UDP-N-acetylenolpyruvoylglucosamine reductase [Pseudobdellovibrionaceae bacterium]|tara:strand:+ start:438 stop:1331 length:894 start_codon:yes stop_codon:yes gene_type:complete